MNGLGLHEVVLSIGDRTLLGPISVCVEPGEILSLRGPSGAGKSSLLKFICGGLAGGIVGLGRVTLCSEDVTHAPVHSRRIGILFQDDLLFPHMSVSANLAFGLRTSGTTRRERNRIIEAALESVQLPGFGPRDPATLSGGQRARVALLRVMLSAPHALLLDEPFAHLDADTRVAVRQLIFDQVRSRRLPTILVTHDAEDIQAAGGPCIELAPVRDEAPC